MHQGLPSAAGPPQGQPWSNENLVQWLGSKFDGMQNTMQTEFGRVKTELSGVKTELGGVKDACNLRLMTTKTTDKAAVKTMDDRMTSAESTLKTHLREIGDTRKQVFLTQQAVGVLEDRQDDLEEKCKKLEGEVLVLKEEKAKLSAEMVDLRKLVVILANKLEGLTACLQLGLVRVADCGIHNDENPINPTAASTTDTRPSNSIESTAC